MLGPIYLADGAGSSVQSKGGSTLLSGKDREVVRLAGQVLAAACAMDLHSELERAQASMRSQQVIGLVEEVSRALPSAQHSLKLVSLYNKQHLCTCQSCKNEC